MTERNRGIGRALYHTGTGLAAGIWLVLMLLPDSSGQHLVWWQQAFLVIVISCFSWGAVGAGLVLAMAAFSGYY